MAGNLDADGKAKPGTVELILAQVRELADGVGAEPGDSTGGMAA
jgi:hypothetical protein